MNVKEVFVENVYYQCMRENVTLKNLNFSSKTYIIDNVKIVSL